MKRNSGQQLKARRLCFDHHKHLDDTGKIWLTCHICGYLIDPVKDIWHADHVVPHTFDGSDDPRSNVKPAHVKCHQDKTKKDISKNAKSKRARDKHVGIRGRGWNTKYKKKMNGQVVLKGDK